MFIMNKLLNKVIVKKNIFSISYKIFCYKLQNLEMVAVRNILLKLLIMQIILNTQTIRYQKLMLTF